MNYSSKETESPKLIEIIRVIFRTIAGVAWTLTVHWLGRARQLLLRGKWKERGIQDLSGVWGRGLAWIMGVHVVRRNERSGPMGDVIISNHMGFLDIPVLLTAFPAVFIMTMDYRRFLYLGQALARQGHVFVDRGSASSRRSARDGVAQVLTRGDRLIVFPEGGSSPGVKRAPFKPFCFHEVARQGKRLEACVIDYLPDRQMLEWDTKRPIIPQLVKLLGRRRTLVSLEFFPSEKIDDPEEAVERFHDRIEGRLRDYDQEKEEKMDGMDKILTPCPSPSSCAPARRSDPGDLSQWDRQDQNQDPDHLYPDHRRRHRHSPSVQPSGRLPERSLS